MSSTSGVVGVESMDHAASVIRALRSRGGSRAHYTSAAPSSIGMESIAVFNKLVEEAGRISQSPSSPPQHAHEENAMKEPDATTMDFAASLKAMVLSDEPPSAAGDEADTRRNIGKPTLKPIMQPRVGKNPFNMIDEDALDFSSDDDEEHLAQDKNAPPTYDGSPSKVRTTGSMALELDSGEPSFMSKTGGGLDGASQGMLASSHQDSSSSQGPASGGTGGTSTASRKTSGGSTKKRFSTKLRDDGLKSMTAGSTGSRVLTAPGQRIRVLPTTKKKRQQQQQAQESEV